MTPSTQANELARLAAVEAVAWTPARADPVLDDIVAIAAERFAAPIAAISLTEREAQNAIAAYGVGRVAVPRDISVCTQTVAGGATLVIADAACDARVRDNPFVVGAPHLRFYAGCVLRSADGYALGTLCLLDDKPRPDFSADDQKELERLARLAEQRLQARALHKRLAGAEAARAEFEASAQHVLKEAIGAFVACDRLSLNLEGRVRASLARLQRECSSAKAMEEVASLRDLVDEMAAIARLERKDSKTGLFEPSAVVRAVTAGLSAYADERQSAIELWDEAAGVEMLGDSWRFEELLEAALSDCVDVTGAPIAMRCAFESLPSGDGLFAIRLSAEHSREPWRLSARNRELIDAMAGAWEVSSGANAMGIFLPARLRTARGPAAPPSENVLSFDLTRKGSR